MDFTLENPRNHHEMAPLFRIREALLLVHHFDLLVDHLSSKAVDRQVNPIVLLSAYQKVFQRLCIERITARLCDDVDQKVPRSRLAGV